MSEWTERILKEFTADLARLWVAADPDDVLRDEHVLSGLRERGFELLPFEDSVVFRAEYEERYRAAWDAGRDAPAKALIIHLRDASMGELPWDYLSKARQVSLSLASLFPKLSYPVLRQIGSEFREALYVAQSRYATQILGEPATKDFILTHNFRIGPHLISRAEDLWRELLRLHYRDAALPPILADHVAQVLADNPAFAALPLKELFSSKSAALRMVQDAWYRYLAARGLAGTRTAEPLASEISAPVDIPFEAPDVRAIVDSMFLGGLLHPLSVPGLRVPKWASVGVVSDPLALRNLVEDGIKSLGESLPSSDSSFREWLGVARRFGEVLARFHALDSVRADGLSAAIVELQNLTDESLQQWIRDHYADLPSLPVAKGPVMVHHIPRFLSIRRSANAAKIVLVVFDGLAIDQWVQIRESLIKRQQKLEFEEDACFAWAPTLTSVSRQAIFSGFKPREFGDTVEVTAAEATQWSRFWQDQGLRANEILYRKGIKRNDHLPQLDGDLSSSSLKVAGIVVDTVDEIVHGAVLGKRGIAAQIESWCESGFVERLFHLLLDKGFQVFVTSDHGNVDAIGQGRLQQGVAAEMRGERVRVYRSEALAADSAAACSQALRMNIPGLPPDFLPIFAGGRTVFLPQGERVVAHGGLSTEELVVPFIRVTKLETVECR